MKPIYLSAIILLCYNLAFTEHVQAQKTIDSKAIDQKILSNATRHDYEDAESQYLFVSNILDSLIHKINGNIHYRKYISDDCDDIGCNTKDLENPIFTFSYYFSFEGYFVLELPTIYFSDCLFYYQNWINKSLTGSINEEGILMLSKSGKKVMDIQLLQLQHLLIFVYP